MNPMTDQELAQRLRDMAMEQEDNGQRESILLLSAARIEGMVFLERRLRRELNQVRDRCNEPEYTPPGAA